MQKNSNKVQINYYPNSEKVRIHTHSDNLYPKYLKYLLEYLKIPSGTRIVFDNKTIEEGINQWLKNNKNKEKF
jgi:hypothetical protein